MLDGPRGMGADLAPTCERKGFGRRSRAPTEAFPNVSPPPDR
jgi:hypothetical protein